MEGRLVMIFLLLSTSKITSITSKGTPIPAGLSIGCATSSYQIEGGWNATDKGENVWDWYTHNSAYRIVDGSNGDIACDSYNRYKEDILLLKEMKLNHYRFSLSWSRILPTGFANDVSSSGVQYYNDLIDELLRNDIEPYVTMYHWDHPQILEDMGGWTNDMMVDWFVEYARVVFKKFGSKVKFFATINEPGEVCTNGYGVGSLAPGKMLAHYGQYLCGHNILKAHASVYHMYNKEFRDRQKGLIGIDLNCPSFYGLDPNDTVSEEIAFQYICGWFAHPLFSTDGDYPPVMKQRIGENSRSNGYSHSLLPDFTDDWIKLIKGSADYFGVNHYTSYVVYPVEGNGTNIWYKDIGLNFTKDPSWKTAASSWLSVVPSGFSKLLLKIKNDYNNPPVYVLENGYSYKCASSHLKALSDKNRIAYLYEYMIHMIQAIEDGCNVKAYTVWSLLDNFEWERGYTECFGLIYVNFTDPNRTRKRKLSSHWLEETVKTKMLKENIIHTTILT